MKKQKIVALSFYINRIGDLTDDFFTPNAQGCAASQRLQLTPALLSAKKAGHQVCVKSLHCKNPNDITSLGNYDICIVGKLSANSDELAQSMAVANLAAITQLKANGTKIVILYCDHQLIDGYTIGSLYRTIFKLADFIIYPTSYLQRAGQKHAGENSKSFLIADPWSIKAFNIPRPSPGKGTWKIIWLGSNKNLQYLLNILPYLYRSHLSKKRIELNLLTGSWAIKKFKKFTSIHPCPGNWRIRLTEWSGSRQPEQLEQELIQSHISIIPSDPTDPQKAGASHNRLVDSVRAGCLTLASPLESYKELSKICLLGKDFTTLLSHAIHDYDRLITKHSLHRKSILAQFSPEINSAKWDKALKIITEDNQKIV